MDPLVEIVTVDQCPYLHDAERGIIAGAEKLGIPAKVVKPTSAADVQARAPSAFGVVGVVLDGELLAYHYLLEKDLIALVSAGT